MALIFELLLDGDVARGILLTSASTELSLKMHLGGPGRLTLTWAL